MSKMTIWRQYQSIDRTHFPGDTSRCWKESTCKMLMKFLHDLRTRCDNEKHPRWPTVAIFVDGLETNFGMHNQTYRETSLISFENILPVVSQEMR